jgi:hypothetical protein
VKAALKMHAGYSGPLVRPLDLGNVEIVGRSNRYPSFRDSNNLSLVAFIHYHDLSICLPGDLESAGWEALLKSQAFCQDLQRVKIFVPSHHGRENGYCPAVFDHCKPDVIIVSDAGIQYDTQKDLYSTHSTGILTYAGETRYVLTTRCDGNIRIEKNGAAPYRIEWGWTPARTVKPAPSLIKLLAGYKPAATPSQPVNTSLSGLGSLLLSGSLKPSTSNLFDLTPSRKDDGLGVLRYLIEPPKK